VFYDVADDKVEDDADVAAEEQVSLGPEQVPLAHLEEFVPGVVIQSAQCVVEIGPEQHREGCEHIAHVHRKEVETGHGEREAGVLERVEAAADAQD